MMSYLHQRSKFTTKRGWAFYYYTNSIFLCYQFPVTSYRLLVTNFQLPVTVTVVIITILVIPTNNFLLGKKNHHKIWIKSGVAKSGAYKNKKKVKQKNGVKKKYLKKVKRKCGKKKWWKKISAAMPNICQKKLWRKVHSYKRLISIKK